MLAKVSFFILLVLGLSIAQNPIPDDLCEGLGFEDPTTDCVCSGDGTFVCEGEDDDQILTGINRDCGGDENVEVTLAGIEEEVGLTSLKVINCGLEDIPSLASLKNLATLDLSGNKLTEVPTLHDDAEELVADLSDNCYSKCDDESGHTFGGNPLTLLDCGGGDVSLLEDLQINEKCVPILMKGCKVDEDDNTKVISAENINLGGSALEIWDEVTITHGVTFDYGLENIFTHPATMEDANKRDVLGEIALTINFSEDDIESFREEVKTEEDDDEDKDDEEEGKLVNTITVYKSDEKDLIKSVSHTSPELNEKESIKLTHVHEEGTHYVEVRFSSASQIAFLFAAMIALSIQLFF